MLHFIFLNLFIFIFFFLIISGQEKDSLNNDFYQPYLKTQIVFNIMCKQNNNNKKKNMLNFRSLDMLHIFSAEYLSVNGLLT